MNAKSRFHAQNPQILICFEHNNYTFLNRGPDRFCWRPVGPVYSPQGNISQVHFGHYLNKVDDLG